MKKALLFIFLSLIFTQCALFKGKRTIQDPLFDFYKTDPPKHTQASLRLTEKARDQLLKGNDAMAIDNLNKALSVDPTNPFAYYFLAKIQTQRNQHREALGLLEKTRHYSADFHFWKAQSHLLSAINYKALGLFKPMNFHLKKAKEFDPEIDLNNTD